ncbi:MAG TPA: carbon-nitrogen hydrolase family protein [Bryobacteraceae bacterium]
MKLAAAQLRPVAGAVEKNILKHRELIELAIARSAEFVLFPELSLTGYEPTLAKGLVLDLHAAWLDLFQDLSDAQGVAIGVGGPTSAPHDGVRISMFVIQPGRPRLIYSKQHLHADELPFFVEGTGQLLIRWGDEVLAPAICYESLQPGHAQQAARSGAHVYLASVAKSAAGLEKANSHYPRIAKQHSLTVLMANSIGTCDNFVAAGQSAAWGRDGEPLGRLDAEHEGIVVVDTNSGRACTYQL